VSGPARLRDFVRGFTALVDGGADEARVFDQGRALLAGLVAVDDWLPPAFAEPGATRYRQYLLYCDPRARFSVASFAWGPGQSTPIHDHTVWGMVGVLRGAERCEEFALPPQAGPLRAIGSHALPAGAIDLVSPSVGDIHRVSNALPDAVSVSIHVYGANIGVIPRHVWDAATGERAGFVSGYENATAPLLREQV
jgi:3-mercaptopropionate dioxygenase